MMNSYFQAALKNGNFVFSRQGKYERSETQKFNFIFFFLLPIREENIVLGSNFRSRDFTDLHVLNSTEYENHIFSGCSVCVCVCHQHNSKANSNRIFKLGTLILYHMQILLEAFYKDRINTLHTRTHKRILMQYGLWMEFLVREFQYVQTALNITKSTFIFTMVKNM